MDIENLPQSDGDEIPFLTKRAYDAHVSRFGNLLGERAFSVMRARGSKTPTDADVDDAYRDLVRGDNPNKARKCIGDAAMIVGGLLLSLWQITPLLTVCGVFLCGLGLYVREYSR